MAKVKTRMLKLREQDQEQERRFQIDWMLSLTTEERFQAMFDASDVMMRTLMNNDQRRPRQVTKRK